MKMRFLGIFAAVALLSIGCGKSEDDKGGAAKTETKASGNTAKAPAKAPATPAKPAAPAANDPMAKAKQLFQMRCVMCHGPSGKGDGPAAANINPKPRNYNSKKWQKSVTDEQIAEVIKKGGQALGLNAMMPGQPDLSDEQITSLVDLIRSFAE